jgi:hypothetical protein
MMGNDAISKHDDPQEMNSIGGVDCARTPAITPAMRHGTASIEEGRMVTVPYTVAPFSLPDLSEGPRAQPLSSPSP